MYLPVTRPSSRSHFLSLLRIHSLSGPSVADAVVGFLDETTLKQHASPAGCCSPIVVVLCMTSDFVNAVAAALRTALPRALVGKMCVALRAVCVACICPVITGAPTRTSYGILTLSTCTLVAAVRL